MGEAVWLSLGEPSGVSREGGDFFNWRRVLGSRDSVVEVLVKFEAAERGDEELLYGRIRYGVTDELGGRRASSGRKPAIVAVCRGSLVLSLLSWSLAEVGLLRV